MNILSNIEDYAGKSIVPVLCGDSIQGTGFFISSKHLLTAGHVIATHITFPSIPIQIKVGDEYVLCKKIINDVEPDFALLECIDYECPKEYVLNIVAGSFHENQKCFIVGYPMELGNGCDYFAVEVKNVRKTDNLKFGFDRIVTRIDAFGFSSYVGFSGSPVINNSGLVIGLQTDQLYNTLAYASVGSFASFVQPYLEKKIETDDALYDDTTFGLGTAKKFTELQYEKGRYRFKCDLHVEVANAELNIESFCGYGLDEQERMIHKSFCDWFSKIIYRYLTYVKSKKSILPFLQSGLVSDELRKEVYELLDERKDNSYILPSNMRSSLGKISRLMSELAMSYRRFTDYQFMCVSGAAGTGKSHLLYREAKRISAKSHIYLFQGLEFKEGELPIETIIKSLGWDGNSALDSLNLTLLKEGRYAIFVIDAINEGAGKSFWKVALPQLKEKFVEYSRLKLLISFRTLSDDDNLKEMFDGDWYRVELKGFDKIEIAFKQFFNAYEIKEDYTQYLSIEEFNNPLFLKIFCETYRQLSIEERIKALRLPIYKKYLKRRNIDVSKNVDEDPAQDITSKLVSWIANQSVMQYDCGNVPRQQVYKRARQISMYRPWSNSLLYSCLKCSVLKEYTSTVDGLDYVDFEYESLGDFLKAGCLLEKNMSDKEKLNYLLRVYRILDDKNSPDSLRSKIFSFLRAYLSVWNPAPEIWSDSVFQNGCLTSILLSSLHFRNVRDSENTLSRVHIESILQGNGDYREPELILNNFNLYSKGLFNPVHRYLLSLPMSERDLEWTTKVNALYEWAQYDELISGISPVSSIEVHTLLQIETWMLTTSYPYIRFFITRKIQDLLSEHPEHIITLIDDFHCVDDSYILIGLYSAIYGAIATVKDTKMIVAIGQQLFNYHYKEGKSPTDIMVRHWTLKIFEYLNHIVPGCDLWDKAQPPYSYPLDLRAIVGDNNYDQEDYFGTSLGSKRINHSLYHWDFSRYIIGTNSAIQSREFFWDVDNAVSLSFIENAIAYIIKNRFGWNDKLGEYDASVPYQTRHDNSVERIGKKYQWLALNEVYAYLCDVCKIKVNVWSSDEHFADVNYPWYVEEKGYYDPTLPKENLAKKESFNLFDVIIPPSTIDLNDEDYIKEGISRIPLYITICDKNGDEWVALFSYCKMVEDDGDGSRERFVFYNPIMVSNDHIKDIKGWMSTENFYGRWMPEHTGSIDFRWNEYPWADSYRVLGIKDDECTECGHQFKLPYFAQLQEYSEGYPEDFDYLSTAYMPCAHMMEMMHWHTAERGIIRDEQHNVVAINRCMDGDPMEALYVKKSQLDEYLNQTKQTLFYAMLGEIVTKEGYNYKNMVRLTGAAMYSTTQGTEVIQPLREEPKVEVNENLTEDEIEKLSNILPATVLKQLQNNKKSDILRALSMLDQEQDEDETE